MKKRLLFSFIFILILGSYYYVQQSRMFQQPSTVSSIVLNEQIKKEQQETYDMTSPPVKLEFQQTKVTVNILPVGLDATGRMLVKDNLDVASWYKQSAVPGNQGNALLAGHRDWKGELGPFQYLENIQKGEHIRIQYENQEVRTFQVIEKQVYHAEEVPASVMNIHEGPRVTLITCTGNFIREKGGYQDRVVVTLQSI
ncbi:class F sortase [Bacillus cereus]|uniref:Class F sortase n=1 Tax=Bacillus cereus TaxID=1396 RepID=A0A9X7M2X1_BACCE|nr:class F sortase [Bacillus cereus]QDZ77445.1 class F sortase [Bacillus cereus]